MHLNGPAGGQDCPPEHVRAAALFAGFLMLGGRTSYCGFGAPSHRAGTATPFMAQPWKSGTIIYTAFQWLHTEHQPHTSKTGEQNTGHGRCFGVHPAKT